ncbi:peroxisome biogenesis factor 2 [Trichogramma pretiosum]|uniref:peroxisome biogenesis factor 2 n=1 Tax=Trichogramma pretiosum TaxID=7493 RepID=UPI0006C975B5|nr:peroxisome biogenesis factor 2 [Trichogramma pretiosum]
MPNPTFVSRINQIDAVQLDHEIYKVLRSQLDEITKYFAPGKIVEWKPEIDALVKCLIWNYSLNANSTTFGQQLLSLSYDELGRKSSILWLLALVLPTYLRQRLVDENFISSRLPPAYRTSAIKDYAERIDNFLHLLKFLWMLRFLGSGNQPRIIETFLGIYNRSSNRNKPRSIGYSYMTRELLWHGLIELFTISIPMIDFRRIQKYWRNIWSSKRKEKSIVLSCKLSENSVCAYCDQVPIFPKWAGCAHVFCYYCLEGLFIASDPYKCPICEETLYHSEMKTHLNI